jgi:hypothetical protein
MANTTYTYWYDVKEYTSITVTAQTVDDIDASSYSSPVTLIWGQGENDSPPYHPDLSGGDGDYLQDLVATDVMNDMCAQAVQTKQYDVRSRWLMFKSERPDAGMSLIILSHNFKRVPTEIKLRDSDATDSGTNDIALVSNNNMRVLLTDSSGVAIDVTTDTGLAASTVNALYVHLADASGDSIDAVGTGAKTLSVSIRDASNNPITSTSTGSTDTAMTAVFAAATGVEQASTLEVTGARYGGRALYYTLADQDGLQYSTSKNDVCDNAMYVHLTDEAGDSVTTTNRISVKFATITAITRSMFDTSVEASLSTLTALNDTSFQLHSLGIANELPVTVWLKVYDMSIGKVSATAEFSNYVSDIAYNLPVPPGDYRDVTLSSGVQFYNGLYFRISQDYPYDNSYENLGGDAGIVYVTGTYSQ